MSERKLHIICHDIPYPPDYGGAMDLFYKIKALHEQGVGIILHCFEYRRKPDLALEQYCDEVHYYPRATGWKSVTWRRPYIVQSRRVPALLSRLEKDNHPVLMEGIHCTGFLEELLGKGRKVYLRAHNVESVYYRQLASCGHSFSKKTYYRVESWLLKRYEKGLPDSLPILCISEKDARQFREGLGKQNVSVLPVFIPCQEITSEQGMGSFCLYHGNLGVAENEKAALWLLEQVFTKIRLPFVVAGRNPSRRLKTVAHLAQHTCLVSDPSDKELQDLMGKAHINILPSFNHTGVKLKVIQALCHGKHCLVNDAAIEGTGLEEACHIGNTADALASIVAQLYHLPFAEEEIRLRNRIIETHFNNTRNAQQLIQLLW